MREYKTQMEAAKKGIVTSEMKTVAEKEGLDPDVIRQRTAAGTIAIPCNINHRSISPEAVSYTHLNNGKVSKPELRKIAEATKEDMPKIEAPKKK